MVANIEEDQFVKNFQSTIERRLKKQAVAQIAQVKHRDDTKSLDLQMRQVHDLECQKCKYEPSY